MKTSFVTTIFNEEKTIQRLLDSLLQQTQIPNEVIIVDGGSNDKTLEMIEQFKIKNRNRFNVSVVEKIGNRSIGRNEGIKKAQGEIIVLSDAGCILDKEFVKEIVKPFTDSSVDVVAGYYRGEAKSIFQECLIPYVLVMPDKINPDTFLPATRSMAIRKNIWKEMGGFDVHLSHNEDYAFAKKLKNLNKNIKFVQNAFVTWIPRKNIYEAFNMFYRFALGDIEAGIMRPKVTLLFVRYLIAFILLFYTFLNPSQLLIFLILSLISIYTLWAVIKNYRYIKKWQAFFLLPMIQYTADLAVILGSIRGIIKRYGI